MRHPFDGILAAGDATPVEQSENTRRSFLRRTLTGAAGLVAAVFGAGRTSHGQSSSFHRGSPEMTTQALGEEGGYYPPPRYRQPRYRQPVTTYALGEESGRRDSPPPYYRYPQPPRRPPHRDPNRYTTFALGEEAGAPPPWHHW
jgi:hypothetical protein